MSIIFALLLLYLPNNADTATVMGKQFEWDDNPTFEFDNNILRMSILHNGNKRLYIHVRETRLKAYSTSLYQELQTKFLQNPYDKSWKMRAFATALSIFPRPCIKLLGTGLKPHKSESYKLKADETELLYQDCFWSMQNALDNNTIEPFFATSLKVFCCFSHDNLMHIDVIQEDMFLRIIIEKDNLKNTIDIKLFNKLSKKACRKKDDRHWNFRVCATALDWKVPFYRDVVFYSSTLIGASQDVFIKRTDFAWALLWSQIHTTVQALALKKFHISKTTKSTDKKY